MVANETQSHTLGIDVRSTGLIGWSAAKARRASPRARSAGTQEHPLREANIWSSIHAQWRRVYGSFYALGVSVESHDFQVDGRFDWSKSFHPNSVEVCINLTGKGAVRSASKELTFGPATIGFYAAGENGLSAWRELGPAHKFVTVEFSAKFLRDRLSACDGGLHPVVEGFMRNARRGEIGAAHQLTVEQERLAAQLIQPPVPMTARSLWYESKVLELMVSCFFERPCEDELFCERQKRVARERVDRVIALLRGRLEEPPTLEEIGRVAGCSPFHLSRTFSQEMGMTIPQYLRKLRIERAAELLRSGKFNVTEAAMEVGYSSLSHFSQAFCQIMGCCPALYPAKGLMSK